MLQAAPAMGAMIHAAKKTGASVETMSGNVIKAMAQGKGGSTGAVNFSAALNRDIQASGANTMRRPQHARAPKSAADSAYLKRIEEYNKARGGRDNA
jgi:hypothetical protein